MHRMIVENEIRLSRHLVLLVSGASDKRRNLMSVELRALNPERNLLPELSTDPPSPNIKVDASGARRREVGRKKITCPVHTRNIEIGGGGRTVTVALGQLSFAGGGGIRFLTPA